MAHFQRDDFRLQINIKKQEEERVSRSDSEATSSQGSNFTPSAESAFQQHQSFLVAAHNSMKYLIPAEVC